jgi:hypothetical protein|tara:strand:- start:1626 stop:4673 length:3048 start_codon:yes stop_codon:yes gene_type:complete
MTQVIRVYNTHANALAENTSNDIDGATVNSDGGTIHNSSSTVPYYTYNRYYYRIDANEPVSEFHIDWDDGEDNSPEKRNVEVIKMEKPSFFAITEHIYTEAKDFWPLIRVKSPEGYLSKWYTNNSSNNDFSALENKTLSAGNTGASIVQIEKDQPSDKIPHFIPATNPPVGVLKTDRKRIFAGIDNKMIDKVTTSQYPLLYAYTTSSEGLGTAALVKLTVQGRMERATREYTLHGDDVLTADGDLNNSTTGGSPAGSESELATKAVPYGNYNNSSGAREISTYQFKTGTTGDPADADNSDLIGDYIIIYSSGMPYLIWFDISGSDSQPTVSLPAGESFADTLRVRLDNSAPSGDQFSGGTLTQSNTGYATKLYDTIRTTSSSHTLDTVFSHANPADAIVTITAGSFGNQTDTTVSDTTHIKDGSDTTQYVSTQGSPEAVETDAAGKLLRAELLNVGKIADTERVYIKVFDATRASMTTFPDVDADDTVCVLSNGNPIIDLNDNQFSFTVDGSESFTRESNINVSSYYFDDDSLKNTTIQSQASVTSNLGNMSDVFHADLGKPSTSLTKRHLSYSFAAEGNLQDSNNRFLDEHRLIRLQVGNNHTIVTGSGDISNRRSFVEHYDDDQYTTTTQFIPSSLQTRGLLCYSNAQNNGATCWRQLNAVSRTNATMIGGAESAGESEYDLRFTPDTADPKAMSAHPNNWLLICKTDLFDRVYFRLDNTYNIGDTAADIDLTAYYSNSGGWKALKIIDNTQRFKTSGSIEFVIPSDWESVTSNGITRADAYGTEELATGKWGGPIDPASDEGTDGVVDDNPRTGHDPASLWDFSAYGILIGINVNSSGATTPAKVNVKSIWPFSNPHSQMVKIIDPHHVSLNDIAIAQSVSFNRKARFTNLTDRFGKSEIRKLGANGGTVTFGSIDLGDTNAAGNRKLIKEHQQNATPVFLDIAHQSGEKTRFFGVITDMSEDHPVGSQYPKYGVTMQISHIIELDSSDNLISEKISIGGLVDGTSEYISAA